MKRKFTLSLMTLFALAFLCGAAWTGFNKYFEITRNIEIFSNVYKEINANYVDQTDPSRLMKTGIDAMLKSLDPFTNYISEAQIENYRLAIEGKY
ncbi:MAG TPA: peptidase S41, partial [Bacteroidales bacterium]|nr:peptidase S41 [Bacteroidales bacterium]